MDITFIKTCGVLLLMKSFRASEKVAIVSIPSLCNGDIVIGHVPRKISSVCSLYIRGGEIHCRVTGSRPFSADLEQGGLEVPIICACVV